MKNKQTINPKDKILQTATELFALKGYSATGLREIAKKAKVNLAMISYYFGSKIGILIAIIDDFSLNSMQIIKNVRESDLPPDQKIKEGIAQIIKYFSENEDKARIVFKELPYKVPEIKKFKSERLHQIKGLVEPALLKILDTKTEQKMHYEIIGPLLICMIYSHFLFKPVIIDDFKKDPDEKFYRMYAEYVSGIFLFGVSGMFMEVKPQRHGDTEKKKE
ncbi:TetR/AcrR family transcriptional regulator [bacterium]|nr:TetR/AcrR family transcriptional regulator [bacterium]